MYYIQYLYNKTCSKLYKKKKILCQLLLKKNRCNTTLISLLSLHLFWNLMSNNRQASVQTAVPPFALLSDSPTPSL